MLDRHRHTAHPSRAVRGHRRALTVAALLAVLALALMLTGCIRILSVDMDTTIEAGPDYVIQLRVQPVADVNGLRGTLAFRYPIGWEVKSVSYSGDQSGALTRSTVIEDYFDLTWESTPVDAVHNGHRAGYTWWAGYTPAENVLAVDDVTATIHIDTHGIGGVIHLDFVTGVTDATKPTDATVNGNGANWEIGGTITEGADGVMLNQTISLSNGDDPEVVDSDPESGAEEVAVDTDPRVTFSEKMIPMTITSTNLYVRTAGGGGVKLPATVSYNATTMQATIDLNDPLEFETDYLLVVESDAKDLVGYTMASDYVAPFTTAAEPVEPLVVAHTPSSGATGVSIGTDVTATFDQPLDPATLDENSFFLERSQGGGWVDVPATVTYSGATQKAILEPDDDLEYETTYRASLTTDIEGANGIPLGDTLDWSFTTEEAPAPAFIDVSPEDPYYAAITGLAAQDIISGYMVAPGVWEFRPENPVRRAQFAKMIDGSLALPVTEADDDSPFTDLGTDILVPSAGQDNLYPHEYVTIAWENGITTGMTATTFSPYDEISRAQVVTMVVRAMENLRPGTLVDPPASYVNTWGTSFSPIHGPNARIAEYNALLLGLPLTTAASDPWTSMPRGEVAQVLWNMMGLTP